MMKRRTIIRLNRTLRHMTPRHIVHSRMTKGVMQRFADKVGLVYFGYVDQKDDDHRIVRGHTVSATHIDQNYCIGTIRGYDVSLVARNDVVLARDLKSEQRCHWLIMTVDLKSTKDIPHLYIGHESRKTAFASSYEQLTPLAIQSLGAYPKDFTSRYTIFGRQTHALQIESIIMPDIAATIASHFKQISIEIETNCIYLYVESQHPDEVLLEKIVSNGLWLAEVIDTRLLQAAKN